ncbi:hypothetical protein BD413DRAFT_490600 [Trametes elegans]|nr:hypothetical protein BD413DRAFT_490600 [Trametes elegans]
MLQQAKCSLLSLALLSFIFHTAAQGATEPQCRCSSSDPCWPNEDDFAVLASQLSSPLLRPVPFAHPCHFTSNPEDAANCSTVADNRLDGNFRSGFPGAMQAPNFETFIAPDDDELHACLLNVSLSGGGRCEQGSVPVVGVDARTVGDVQLAVKFAAARNLRLVIKNTGHDFLGRSSGRDSFMIWTHNLKTITAHAAFRPQGAPADEIHEHAFTFGAGVQWHEAYAAADSAGRMIVGGVSDGGSVGAGGGWFLGGGHSALSPSYGLGVDNVLEISVVTADGAHLVVNAYQHADLFWALRGGGGGTFGVVTSVTYRTYPVVPVNMAIILTSTNASKPTPSLTKAFSELVRITPTLTDAGWGGYTRFTPANDMVIFSMLALLPNASLADATRMITPYFDYVHAVAENSTTDTEGVFTVLAEQTTRFSSYLELISTVLPETGGVGANLELGSWLLPRDVLESGTSVAETLLAVAATSGLSYQHISMVAGGAVSKVNASSTGLNPAWRSAGAHAVCGTTWPDGTSPADIRQLREALLYRTGKLRALAPESVVLAALDVTANTELIRSGQASMFEPDAPKAFFGAHYPGLRAIKKIYDPAGLFLVREGVGADEWDSDLRCRRSRGFREQVGSSLGDVLA